MALAAKERHDSRVHLIAPLIHCSAVPRSGALEVYGLFRSTFSLDALSNSKTISFGPLKDISIYVADGNTKNTAFAPQKRNVVAGLQFECGLPGGGLLNVAPVFYQEWNHNGIAAQFFWIEVSQSGCVKLGIFAAQQ